MAAKKKHSKRYLAALKKLPDPEAKYPISEAVGILKKFDGCKFDETVEVSIKLGIDPKKPEQLIRGSFALPHGLGKEKKVIAFAEGPDAEACRQAGAAEVGTEDLAKKILDGWMDFDVAVAHPTTMKYVGKLGRVLGPQGKMPSPKSGTVTDNVAQAVKEFKGGKIEYRADASGNVQAPVGKKSFPQDKLADNVNAFIEHIQHSRPSSAKGAFLERATISATMSPGIDLAVATAV
ncbi:MAG TPA: 50S ribosomal protein L1 [Planctomycetota bacterium]|nr:50S ribosomal protein L1 [Planctomycetota bacterium]